MPPLSLRGAEDSITHVPWGFGCSSSRPITSPRNVTEALGGLLAFSEDGGDCLLPFQALQLLTVAVSLLHPPSPPNTQTPSILFSASTITISNMFTRSGCQSPGCFTKFMNVDFFFCLPFYFPIMWMVDYTTISGFLHSLPDLSLPLSLSLSLPLSLSTTLSLDHPLSLSLSLYHPPSLSPSTTLSLSLSLPPSLYHPPLSLSASHPAVAPRCICAHAISTCVFE